MIRPAFVYVWCALVLCAFALCGSPLLAASGDEWPQWRGTNRDGISPDKGLLKVWSEDGPPLAWKGTNIGIGLSAVSVAGGKVFTMGDRGDSGYVICLDAADGKEVWAQKVGAKSNCGNNGEGPHATPAIDGKMLYALTGNGELACLETATGKEVWKKDYKKDFGGHMMSGWNYSESPLVDGDRLICTPGGKDSTLVALDKKTGKEIWHSKADFDDGKKDGGGAAYASIVISKGGGVKQYVQLLGHGIVGIRAEDGKQLWGYTKIANGTANVPTPIVKDDYVFCVTGYGTGAALLKLKSSSDGVNAEQVYFLKGNELQNTHGGVIMVGDYIYGGHQHNNGFPFCLEWKTGKVLYNKERGPGKGSAAVGYADGLFYFRYEDGVMSLLDMQHDGFKVLSKFKIPDVKKPSWPQPVIVGGKLYLREQDTLYCYNVKG